jgi:hypothetical protein
MAARNQTLAFPKQYSMNVVIGQKISLSTLQSHASVGAPGLEERTP